MIIKIVKNIYKDENGGGSTIMVKVVVFSLFFGLLIHLLVDYYLCTNIYRYAKNQQDLANRAVYSQIDVIQLASRNIYIDENLGRIEFEKYLRKNLELDNNLIPTRNIRIVGRVEIIEFEIYNASELPATTPGGEIVEEVAVYSKIRFEYESLLSGIFGTTVYEPELTTDVPDIFLRTVHP